MRSFGIPASPRVGWLVTGILTLVTAGWAILDADFYTGLIASATLPGAFSQDVVSLITGFALCGAAARTPVGPKSELVALGLFGYLFYSYGIYAIERVYNVLYLSYRAIFGLAA